MLKGDGFGPHGEEHGGRLRKQLGLGPSAIGRRFVTVGEEPFTDARAGIERADRVITGLRAQVLAGPKKRGPAPSSERPWEAMGISRRTYFRRKKGGGG